MMSLMKEKGGNMITYEVAFDKAKRMDPDIDSYQEFPNAFVFTNSKAEGDDQWDNEVVIDRKTGNIISYFKFVISNPGVKKDIPFKPI